MHPLPASGRMGILWVVTLGVRSYRRGKGVDMDSSVTSVIVALGVTVVIVVLGVTVIYRFFHLEL